MIDNVNAFNPEHIVRVIEGSIYAKRIILFGKYHENPTYRSFMGDIWFKVAFDGADDASWNKQYRPHHGRNQPISYQGIYRKNEEENE